MSAALDEILNELADRIATRISARAPSAGDYVNEDEFVALVGSKEKAKRLVKTGAVAGSLVGRRIVAERASLYAFIDSQRVTPRNPGVSDEEAAVDEAFERAGLRAIVGGKR